MTVGLTNNLIRRSTLILVQGNETDQLTVYLYNNLFAGTNMTLSSYGPAVPWVVRDNLFDTVSLTASPNAPPNANNGYFNTTQMSGTGNKTITTTDYQSGPLGANYYPSTGSQLFTLVNAGSRTPAAAGLAQHTVRFDQIKEDLLVPSPSGLVDIGFHYVALNGSTSTSTPADSDTPASGGPDGLADCFEDVNGNGNAAGAPDLGETDWNTYNSQNGFSTTPALLLFTPLK